jgi:hypothetical protein
MDLMRVGRRFVTPVGLASVAVVAASVIGAPSGRVGAANEPDLVVSSMAVHSGERVTIQPASPCAPPSGAGNPVAQVGVSDAETSDAIGVPIQQVPVAADGSWSATAVVTGTGHHEVVASCWSSPQAKSPYLTYVSGDIAVPTTSVGYWARESEIREFQVDVVRPVLHCGARTSRRRGLRLR